MFCQKNPKHRYRWRHLCFLAILLAFNTGFSVELVPAKAEENLTEHFTEIDAPAIWRPGIAETILIHQLNPANKPATVSVTLSALQSATATAERVLATQNIVDIHPAQIQQGIGVQLVWPEGSGHLHAQLRIHIDEVLVRETAVSTTLGTLQHFGQHLLSHPAGGNAEELPPLIIAARAQIVRLLRNPLRRQKALQQAEKLMNLCLNWQPDQDLAPRKNGYAAFTCPATGSPLPYYLLYPELSDPQFVIDYWPSRTDEFWPSPDPNLQQLATSLSAAVIIWPSSGGWSAWGSSRSRFGQRPVQLAELPRVLLTSNRATLKHGNDAMARFPGFWASVLALDERHLLRQPTKNTNEETPLGSGQTWQNLLYNRCRILLAPAEHALMRQRQEQWVLKLQRWAAAAQGQFVISEWNHYMTTSAKTNRNENLIILGPLNKSQQQEIDRTPLTNNITWDDRLVRWPNGHGWRADALASTEIHFPLRPSGPLVVLLSGDARVWSSKDLGQSWKDQQVLTIDPMTPDLPRILWQP